MTGGTVSRCDSSSNVLSAQVRGTSHMERFELDRTRVSVLNGYHYPSPRLDRIEFRIQDGVVGRGRTVSRVLYPLRDGDHLSWTPVARRLQRPIPEGSASSLIP